MFRALRVLVIAAIIAASLALGGSAVSADTITVRFAPSLQVPASAAGITWE